MRINANTYPAYDLLQKDNLEFLQIDMLFEDNLFEHIETIRGIYRQVTNRYYLTNTFKDAIYTSFDKIKDTEKHLEFDKSDCGIIFTDKGFFLYLFNPQDKLCKLCVYGFTRTTLTSFFVMNTDNKLGGIWASVDKNGNPFNNTDDLSSWANTMLIMLYFIYNCDIEQVLVKPNEKAKHNSNKYMNETKSNIQILDCRWFTELVREAPFMVNGHLRWQVCGENFKKRKLIWVNTFEKKGYNRKPIKELA